MEESMRNHHGKLSSSRCLGAVVALGLLALSTSGAAAQYQIVVTNYGVSANGMPFAIAKEKKLFEAEGITVTDIITSAGGGTTLRNMMAANAPYAEINPAAAIGAVQQGLDLKIIAENVQTVSEFTWFSKKGSKFQKPADLKGARIGFNNPRSTSVALIGLLLEGANLSMNDVKMVRTGGFGESLAALEIDTIDATPMTEPLWSQYKDKYHAIAVASEVLPPLSNVVGVTLASIDDKQKNFVRAVIRARRAAVKFMEENTQEAGDIVAKHYNIPLEVARSTVSNLIKSRTQGIPYWGTGQINYTGLDRMVKAQQSVAAIEGNVNLEAIIDTNYLPEDIRKVVR
jgi:NitT/TauT family transport system substrate-binding protein